MSGAEVIAVVACVAAVVSAYRDGSGLVRKIRERRRARRALREAETQQLESSLELGPVVVQGQYDHDFRRFGEEYARGDQIAREQMKDVLITLQLQILHNLRGIWDTDAEIDYVAIQHASDESRVNAVVCLGQLYQRLAVAAPPNAMQIPVSYGQYPSYLQHLAPLHNMVGSGMNQMTQPYALPLSPPRSDRSSASSAALTPDMMTSQTNGLNFQQYQQRQSSYSSQSASDPVPGPTASPPVNQFRHRSSLRQEGPSSVPSYPIVPTGLSASPQQHGIEQIAPLFSDRTRSQTGHSYRASQVIPSPEPERLSTTSDTSYLSSTTSSRERHDPDDFDHMYVNPWRNDEPARVPGQSPPQTQQQPKNTSPSHLPPCQSPTPYTSSNPGPFFQPAYELHSSSSSAVTTRPPPAPATAASINSQPPPAGIMTRNLTSRSTFLTFPSEANNYLGFCKGAWRLQIGDLKKAFNLEQRPIGITMTLPYWRCSKCCFEGPAQQSNGLPRSGSLNKSFDTRVRVSRNGIQYRWTFIAKSHIESKKSPPQDARDGSIGTFGCIFCCAEGGMNNHPIPGTLQQTPTSQSGDSMSVHSANSNPSSLPEKRSLSSRFTTKSRHKSNASVTANSASTAINSTPTPVFGTLQHLLDHLDEHRRENHEPSSALLERAKCIIGRWADADEEFDINLPPLRVQEVD